MGGAGTEVRALLQMQQVRYLVVAGATASGYLGLVATGLAMSLPYMLAIAAAQVATIACAFPAYRRWVFASSGRWQSDLRRFLSVWSTGMVAGLAGTPALVELAGMPPLGAQVLAIALVAVGSYLGHRFYSFGRGSR